MFVNTPKVGEVGPDGYRHEQLPNRAARRNLMSKRNKGEFGSRRILFRINKAGKRIRCAVEKATHYMHPTKNLSGTLA